MRKTNIAFLSHTHTFIYIYIYLHLNLCINICICTMRYVGHNSRQETVNKEAECLSEEGNNKRETNECVGHESRYEHYLEEGEQRRTVSQRY